ncbi:MAG: histidine--tRNA ligase, partial [Clostridia bacterium]|nr:histidine--tRNA ligase [Clostridia bacterium]
ANAPKILDYLCDDCKEHFDSVQKGLKALDIPFTVNSGIVRGLDYYTRTVFEFVSTDIGAQGTVCGGGRYNHLVEEVGGKPTPAAGFGLGLERLLLVLENTNNLRAEEKGIDVYVAPLGERASDESQAICQQLRVAGLSAETDLMGRSLKAQMKYADKINAHYVAIIGDDELDQGVATVKNMKEGESKQITLDDLKKGNL